MEKCDFCGECDEIVELPTCAGKACESCRKMHMMECNPCWAEHQFWARGEYERDREMDR